MRGHLSSSCFRARSMFIRWPTRVTPSSAKSSLVRAGRWDPSISCSWKRSRCSARLMLASQSPTSYLFHRCRGFWWKGRNERSGEGTPGECPGEGERLLALELLMTKRTSFGSWGRLRLEDFRMVGAAVGEVARPKPRMGPSGSERSGEAEPGLGVRRVIG